MLMDFISRNEMEMKWKWMHGGVDGLAGGALVLYHLWGTWHHGFNGKYFRAWRPW
jgi:hypothetical protein